MKKTIVTILATKFPLLLIAFSLASLSAFAEKPLNIIWIGVDDLRPQLHSYGFNEMITPNLDRLAAWLLRAYNSIEPMCNNPSVLPQEPV